MFFKQFKIIDDYNVGTTQGELCKKYKISKEIIHRLVNKFKTKGTVETEHLGGRLVKRTPHTVHKIIRYVKIKHGDGNRLMVYRWLLGFSELEPFYRIEGIIDKYSGDKINSTD